MTNPHNVDICVTCISDKPPRLPLREELPSLGIEVIYNAEGTAAKTTLEEATRNALKAIRTVRKSKYSQPLKKVDPPEMGEAMKLLFNPKKDAIGILAGKEDAGSIPTALSYSTYKRALEKRNQHPELEKKKQHRKNPFDEEEDDSLDSTVESLMDENRPENKGGKIGHNEKSPDRVEIKSKEEDALKEAFKVFSPIGTSTAPKEEESQGFSSNSNPSTLTSFQTTNSKLEKKSPAFVRVIPSGEAKDDFPDLVSYDDEEEKSFRQEAHSSPRDDMYDGDDSLRGEKEARLDGWDAHGGGSSLDAQFGGSVSPGSGNIKVSLFSHGSNVTEMYDLTEVSEVEGNVSSFHGRSDLEPLYGQTSFRHSHGSFASPSNHDKSIDIPEVVINLSDVYEESGPDAPLVNSPRSVYDEESSFSHVMQVHRSLSPVSRSPTTPNVHNEIKKNHSHQFSTGLSIDSYNRFNTEDQREDIDVLDSPENDGRSIDSDRYSSPTSARQLRQSSFHHTTPVQNPFRYHEDRSFPKLQIGDSYHAAISARGSKPLSQINEDERFDSHLSATTRSASFSLSPTQSRSNSSSLPTSLLKQRFSSRLAPALKKNPSHDSRTLSRVSFSQDVEERIYNQDDAGIQYKDSMSEVKSPLAAIIHEDRDLNEPLPSALSREADDAFRALADKLGMEQKELRSSELMLVEALSFGEPIPFDFEETLKRNPDLASERLPKVDSYALHAACSRTFPERFGVEQKCRVKDLVDDIVLHKKLIGALVAANPNACMRVDQKGDLPAHIMARRLMEWEAKWYQKVYEKAKFEDNEEDNGTGITKLYQTMSECMNILLQPVPRNPSLCLKTGSVGRLLPLHIAAIFTVSYTTLLSLLEAYPDAASAKCDLSNMRTFIPDRSLPLELHDRLSTDFPKWEIQRVHSSSSEEISQLTLDKTYGVKNCMRRSDLMFAFYPNSLPYRKDEERIRRMEQRIQQEIMENESLDDYSLSLASESFWVWMCEFENPEDIADHYAESVERIVNSLPTRAVRYLATVLNRDDRPVIDTVTCKSSDVIYERLKNAAETDIAVPTVSLNTGFSSTERSFLLRQLDEEMASRFCLHGRGFIGPMCRTLFNISETAFPSSFVLLPYKLVKDRYGRLGLDSAQAAQAAMKFADSLLKLTTPTSIIQVLDRKATRFTGCSLIDENNFEWWTSQPKQKDVLSQFLSLYTTGPAYFYFIDEYTGVPIVDEKNGAYPLAIYEAEDVVRKVFPLMLAGMILMRGEKAVSILANVLLDKNITLVHPHWIKTAKDLVAYLFSPQIEWTKTSMYELFPIRDRLLALINKGPTTKVKNDDNVEDGLSSEWVVESSLIKMVVEMHDTRHNYAGLKARRSGFQVMWTLEADFLNPESNEYLMQIDFMTPEELKRFGKQQRRSFSEVGMTNFDVDDNKTGYDVLFGDLALTDTDIQSEEKDETKNAKSTPTIVKMSSPRLPHNEEPVRSRYSTHKSTATSLLDFDESLDLDDVLKLRIQLDEQEAKLEFLREKIADLEEAENELLDQEERIGELISDIINSKETMVESPSKVGLSKARALLLRICHLEERVLCGEVEIGQLKNDITLMELEAADPNAKVLFDDKSFDSQSMYDHDDDDDDGSLDDDDDDGSLDDETDGSAAEVDEDSSLDSFGEVKVESTFRQFTPQNSVPR